MIGRTLSHYKVLDELSRGGMGIVYRALDLKLNREVALKVLPPELVAGRPPDRFLVRSRKRRLLRHVGVRWEAAEGPVRSGTLQPSSMV